MRAAPLLLVLAAAGCAPSAPGAPVAGAAVAAEACAAAVAAHVGEPESPLAVSPPVAAQDGGLTLEVRDRQPGSGDRLHVCRTDAGGRIRAIEHPGA